MLQGFPLVDVEQHQVGAQIRLFPLGQSARTVDQFLDESIIFATLLGVFLRSGKILPGLLGEDVHLAQHLVEHLVAQASGLGVHTGRLGVARFPLRQTSFDVGFDVHEPGRQGTKALHFASEKLGRRRRIRGGVFFFHERKGFQIRLYIKSGRFPRFVLPVRGAEGSAEAACGSEPSGAGREQQMLKTRFSRQS